MEKISCFACHKELEFVDKVGFRAECMYCHADAHVCRNCKFYDPKVYNECLETSAEVVRQKDRANYCEFFQSRAGASGKPTRGKEDLLTQAEALFKKK